MKAVNFKDFFGVIRSGIVGALVVTGGSIILVITGIPFVSYFFSKLLASYTPKEFLIMAGGIGFILGLAIRRKFPIIQRGVAPIVIAAIPLIIGAWFIYAVARNVLVPQSIKLMECTNNILEFSFRAPKGHSYNFVLGTPGVGRMLKPPFLFSGHIHMSNETTNVEFPINSELARQCNWLEGNGVPYSLILTDPWNTNSVNLDRLIREQESYNVKIVFDQPPPHSTSIWLYWLQAAKDKGK